MSLNSTPAAERLHIGIFGRRNAGKSCVINAITGQKLAIVSDVLGTTTDPVYKAMELLPLGPVMFIDTPGLDDTGALGQQRIEKAYQALNKTDIALMIVDASQGMASEDMAILDTIKAKKINYLVVFNKIDLVPNFKIPAEYKDNGIAISAETGINIFNLKEKIGHLVPNDTITLKLVGDLLAPNDLVILVVPIDSAAPKGRLILPQQETIRDILEAKAKALIVQTSELAETLATIGEKPRMVITDSQAFDMVAKTTPLNLPLTSFSILFARYKGDLEGAVRGAVQLENIQDGDQILISEGCTHHRQCNDIGTVKLPDWVRKYTGKKPVFSYTSGTEFPGDLSPYKLIIHCGGCMLNAKEMIYRYKYAQSQHIPMTNYGIAIAYMHGILKRSLAPFPSLAKILPE
jgi:[FeFe] hydrogenase H-cluster maturation GTPase HydF